MRSAAEEIDQRRQSSKLCVFTHSGCKNLQVSLNFILWSCEILQVQEKRVLERHVNDLLLFVLLRPRNSRVQVTRG